MQFAGLAFISTSLLALGTAAAQQPPPQLPPSVLPGLLPTSTGTTLDGRIDYTRIRDEEAPSPLALGLHVQHVTRAGLGGYGSLPIAQVEDGSDRETVIGNLELGGLYMIRGDNFVAYVRGGLALRQTNTDGGDGDLVPLATYVPRLGDASSTGHGSSWVRIETGLRRTSGSLVVGSAGGIDAAFDDDGRGTPSVFHLSGSIGLVRPEFGLAAGATLLLPVDESQAPTIVIHTVGDFPLGARARFYSAINFDPKADLIAVSIGFGVRVGL